jgi:hypothetical protein
MALTPYRAMPLPRSPRQSWRPVVERTLALFNAAALVALAAWWATHEGEHYGDKADQARVLAAVALGGTIGFLGWFSYGLRLKLILASGLVWALSGAVTLFYGLSPYPYMFRFLGRSYPATAGGIVFVAVGIASVATFWSRDRTRVPSARADAS